jgi:hypothetical protein
VPSRSALSRFLDALTEAPVEALRTLFLDDLLSRPSISGANEKQTGSLVDRAGNEWTVIDLDGTREAARRLDEICAPGYTGRKRGEVVRTRTTISQAHSYHWLGSFGNRGNGRYREELRKGLAAITRYLSAYQLPSERTLLRLDGLYGTGAVLVDLAGFAFVTRGKEYTALDHPLVQARLHLPPDQYPQRTAKPDSPHPLRLSRDPGGTAGRAVSRGRRHASRHEKEEPRWRHTRGHRVRTLLDEFAAARVYGLRRRRTLLASRCL